jgi:hypothetical protein
MKRPDETTAYRLGLATGAILVAIALAIIAQLH